MVCFLSILLCFSSCIVELSIFLTVNQISHLTVRRLYVQLFIRPPISSPFYSSAHASLHITVCPSIHSIVAHPIWPYLIQSHSISSVLSRLSGHPPVAHPSICRLSIIQPPVGVEIRKQRCHPQSSSAPETVPAGPRSALEMSTEFRMNKERALDLSSSARPPFRGTPPSGMSSALADTGFSMSWYLLMKYPPA